MAILPKPEQSEVPVMVGRRSTRLSVAVPILLTGTDAAGNAFKEHTFTLNVNKHGAEIATSRMLAPGSEITIENVSLGRKGQVRVVHRREKRTPNSPYEVSVELLNPENIWGVRFPPADWDNGSKNGKSAWEKRAVTEPAPSMTSNPAPEASATQVAPAEEVVTPSEVKKDPPAGEADAPEISPSAGQTTEAPGPPEPAKEAMAAAEPSDGIARPDSEAPRREPETSAAAMPELPPAPPDTFILDEKVAAARAQEQHLAELLGRLESASARLESALAQAGEAQAKIQAASGQALAEAGEASRQAAQSTLEEFSAKLRARSEANSQKLLDETRQRLEEEASVAVSAFAKQAGAHLSRLTQESGPELEAKQKAAVSQAKDQIAGAAETAGGEFEARLKKAAEDATRSFESSLKASIEESVRELRGHFAQSLRSESDSMMQGAGGAIERLRQQMREEAATAQAGFREACASEASQSSARLAQELEASTQSLRKTAEEANAGLWESSKSIKYDLTFKAEKLRKQLADLASAAEQGFHNYTDVQLTSARDEIRESFRTLTAQSTQQFTEQLQKTADAILESNAPHLHRQAEDAGVLCKGMLETCAQEMLQQNRARLGEMALESLQAFSAEARSASEQIQVQLRLAFERFLAGSAQEVESTLRRAAEAAQKAAVGRIELEGSKASDQVVKDFKTRMEGAAQEAADSVYKQIGVATVVLKDWGDQATTRLEAQFKNSMEAFERRVRESATAALEANRRQSEEATRELRRRLEQAARILSAGDPESSPDDPSSPQPKS